MKYFGIVAVLLCATPLFGQTPHQRARAALALAASSKLDCGCCGIDLPCRCGPNCTCQPQAKTPPNPLENLTYQIAYARAVANNKPLLIWVGETCPSCENSWTDYIHCRCTEYDGVNDVVKGPCVIVAKPDGMGGMTRLATLNNIPSLQEVQTVLGVVKQAAPQQTFFPPPQPMFFGGGGFGGGGGGGGC